MNQSDIRGLVRESEPVPTGIFFVVSFAFYVLEFSPLQTYPIGWPQVAGLCLRHPMSFTP